MMRRAGNIISVEKLSIGYKVRGGMTTVMEDISLSARSGELVALIGRNGSGKSTLLRTIASLQEPLKGHVMIDGKTLDKAEKGQLPLKISFTSTEPLAVHNIKVREVVALGRFPYTNWLGTLSADDLTHVNNALSVTGLLPLADRNIDSISDGEKQRALIARALAQNTEILVMDEPTAFLDLPSRFSIVSLLRKLTRESGKCVIYSTHDLDTALNEADIIWLMSGDSVFHGAPEDLLLTKDILRAFESPMLSFNQATGNFSFIRTGAGEIAVEASGIHRKRTEKALHRCGFRINQEAASRIEVRRTGEITEWVLSCQGEEISCSSIYDLVLHLPFEP